ncbi:hypothetical protein AB9F34_34065, partial [Rhizobium leguminosarum]
VSVVLTFLPINFLHPVRVKRLRPLNLGVFFLWSGLGIFSLLMHFDTPETMTTVSAVVALASMTNRVKTIMFQTTGKPEKKYSS